MAFSKLNYSFRKLFKNKSTEIFAETIDSAAVSVQRQGTESDTATSSAESTHESLLPEGATAPLVVNDESDIIKHGKFDRTKIIDCNRKAETWVKDTYGCLTNESFLLFDSEYRFEIWQQNPFLNAKLINMKMDLNVWKIEKESGRTSTQENVLILTNTENVSRVLIHFEDANEFKLWQEMISATIHLAIEAAQLQVVLSESSVDEKPWKDQRKIKERLRDFFAGHRLSINTLIQTEIYRDALFGSALEVICQDMPRPKIPKIVQVCIEAIEPFINTEGLYRINGNMAVIQRIRFDVEQNDFESIDPSKVNVNNLTGVLKLFFRELKISLIPPSKYESFSVLLEGDIDHTNIIAFRNIVKTFPEAHYDTLKFLMSHLLKVSEHEQYNRMDITNLATVWAPTLFHMKMSRKNPDACVTQMLLQRKLIYTLLKNFHTVFD